MARIKGITSLWMQTIMYNDALDSQGLYNIFDANDDPYIPLLLQTSHGELETTQTSICTSLNATTAAKLPRRALGHSRNMRIKIRILFV